ncbi:MAG: GTPase [Candidatus Aenigmatarchaeota archaeon]
MAKNRFLARTIGVREKIRRIVKDSDLVIEVLDARDPKGTRNTELERLVKSTGKVLGIVVNKMDLVHGDVPTVTDACMISSKNRESRRILTTFIHEKLRTTPAKVAIVGYPNVGKSTIINMLKGRRSASVAPIPGHTKGVQWLRIDEDILLLDSPGIVPSYERDEVSMAKKGAIEADQLKDPEYAAEAIIEEILRKDPSVIAKAYDITVSSNNPRAIIESIAIRRGRLLKGNEPDMLTVSKVIIRDHYKGRI